MSLASEGARVAICARDPDALEAARDEIASISGSTVAAVRADVSLEDDARRFVRAGAAEVGGCQILVANAGGPPAGRFDALGDEDFREALDLTLFSTLRMAREAIPLMREARYGRIVIISSSSVKQPIPNLILSNSIRAAVIGWAKTLADEVGPDGITLHAVLPGRVLTDRARWLVEQQAGTTGRSVDEELEARAREIPLGRYGDPTELGDVVAFLASERAAYITGASLLVDGGLYRGLL